MPGKYRPNAAVIVTDGQGRVLLCERTGVGEGRIQTVQGGIDAGETPREAAIREMNEELGLSPEQFSIVDEMGPTFRYDFPPEIRAQKPFIDIDGQEQKFFLAKVDPDVVFRLDADEVQEFSSVSWGKPEELAEQIWEAKRPGTIAALRHFGLLAETSPLLQAHQLP